MMPASSPLGRDLEQDGAAHRAAHDHRPLQPERLPDRADDGEIGLRRQPVFLEPPAVRRRGAAVIRQVESDDPKAVGHRRVVHDMTILPAVGAGGVEAK
jgi:hypothetical protein